MVELLRGNLIKGGGNPKEMQMRVLIKGRKYIVKAGETMNHKISTSIKQIIDNQTMKWIDPINTMQTIKILINFKKPKNKKTTLLNFKETFF